MIGGKVMNFIEELYYCELYSKEIVYDESLLDKNDCQKFNKLEEYSKKV